VKLKILGIPVFEYRSTYETDGINLQDPDTFLKYFGGGRSSKSGIDIDEDSALTFSAVWACVRILSESVASLPLGVYRKEQEGKELLNEHPTYKLLHDRPNAYNTSFTWRETMVAFVVLWGNAYARIEHRGDMRVESLDIVHPGAVTPFIASNGELFYRIQYPDRKEIIPSYEMLHVAGLGFDGLKGKAPIDVAKEAIGLGLGAESFGAEFFGKGANSDVILSYPGKLSKTGKENLGGSFDKSYREDKQKTIVLEEGVKMERVTIPPEQAQFLQTRKFQISEIARIFRVPPHLIGDLDRATNNNIEHQSIEFVTHTIRPWVKRFEQEFDRKLFYESERGKIFTKFNIDGLLRGDSASRATIMSAMFNAGALTPNEIRGMNNLNHLEGGDMRYINSTLKPIDETGKFIENEGNKTTEQ